MKRLVYAAVMTLTLTAGITGQQASRLAGQLDAAAIMEKNFQASKVTGVRLEASMVLINDKGQQRERRNTTVIALQDNRVDSKFAVKFSTPADIKGTAFLQVEHTCSPCQSTVPGRLAPHGDGDTPQLPVSLTQDGASPIHSMRRK